MNQFCEVALKAFYRLCQGTLKASYVFNDKSFLPQKQQDVTIKFIKFFTEFLIDEIGLLGLLISGYKINERKG